MDKKSLTKNGLFSWKTEDFSEYMKLIGLPKDGVTGKITQNHSKQLKIT